MAIKRIDGLVFNDSIPKDELVADIVKSTAEVFKKDLPYLYQIVPQSKIWIDLQVEKEGVYVK